MFNTKTIILAKALRPDLNFASPGAEELVWLKIASRYASGNPVRDATIENGIAYFDRVSVSQPLVSLKLNIPVTQTGSGTPSPDNIRDFVGFSGVTITRSNGVDIGDTYTISFGQTVYSANLDVLTGKLSITHGIVDLTTLSWIYDAANTRFYTRSLVNIVLAPPDNSTPIDGVCSHLQVVSFTSLKTASNRIAVAFSGNVFANAPDYTTVEDFLVAFSGAKLVYPLATPIEIDLTPTQIINTLIGENVIFADVGDITECKYTRK